MPRSRAQLVEGQPESEEDVAGRQGEVEHLEEDAEVWHRGVVPSSSRDRQSGRCHDVGEGAKSALEGPESGVQTQGR